MKKKNTDGGRRPAVVAEPVEVEVVPEEKVTALTVATRLPKVKGRTAGERINFLHRLSVQSGKVSIAAAIMAGWELEKARQACQHGAWLDWLERNTALSVQTADRYRSVYRSTVGSMRLAMKDPAGLETRPTVAELETASSNVEAKSLTDLYSQLRLMKRGEGWGGGGRGQGRKAKDVEAELDAIAKSEPLMWGAVKGALDTIMKLEAERDVTARLTTDHLGEMSQVLAMLSERAAKAFARRLGESAEEAIPLEATADLAKRRG